MKYFYKHVVQDNKAVALLIVISTVAILTIFMVELNYKTNLYIKVSSSYKESTQAYYLSQSSVNLALVRLAIFNKLKNTKIGNIKVPAQFLDVVWSFPLSYPFPTSSLGGESSFNVDTDINKYGTFSHSIIPLDDKFNLNTVLLSEKEEEIFLSIVGATYDRLLETEEDFGAKYTKEDFINIANNIIDWIDFDNNSRNGGDEDVVYLNKNLDYKPRNGPIPSLFELKMIDGMNDELFKIFKDKINLFASSLNPNDLGFSLWQILLPETSSEDLKNILKEKELYGIPFTSEEEIKNWLFESFAIKSDFFNPSKLPLAFDRNSFKIKATGVVGKTKKTVSCYISDMYKYLNSYGFLNKTKNKVKDTTKIVPDIVFWELE